MLPPKDEELEAPRPSSATGNSVEGRIIYLLILVALVNFIYPITLQWPGPATLIIYNVFYVGMFAASILIVRGKRRLRLLILATAFIYFTFSILYALEPNSSWRVMFTYLALIPYQLAIIWVLERFTFAARRVNRDVLFAAVTIYLLLGAIFVPIYGILELVQPGSIIDGASPDTPVVWQQLIYYSLVTLTTTGYGDILPISPWVRAVANVQSVMGVLFLAVTMARLVGLYSQHES
ncbi:MAG: ion channel [Chloroflexota bacterium]|jgi:hypothetical protein